MIPEGNWKAKGGEWAFGTAKTGTDQVGVDMELLDGPAKGSHITAYLYFTDAAFERTIESLRLLGWKETDLSDLTGIGTTEVYVVIAHEEDQNGEIRARVQWINAQGGVAMANRMDEGRLKVFAAEMRGKVLALDAAGGRTPKPTGQPRTPAPRAPAQAGHVLPPEDDNIPF